MKDFIGQEIREGDRAVYHTAGRYGDLQHVKVIGFTPRFVRYAYPEDETHYRPAGKAAPHSLIIVEANLKALEA